MALTEVGLAGASFTMPATRWLLSPQGVISLGTLAVLADGPLGCAVHSALPPATGYATSELSLRLLRPARAGGTFVARGRLVHAGKSLALSSVQIVDAGGRLLADGSSLCFVRSLRGASPPPPAERADEPGPHSPDPYERPELGRPVGQEAWVQLSGLEVLQAIIAGDLPNPPIHYLTGLRATQVASGEATFTMPCHEWLCSPLGTIEGGTIAMLADGALVSAIQTMAPPNTAVAAIDLKVNFLRPVLPDGRELVARGRVRHAGRTICLGEADVLNADGKAVAVATGSAILLPGRAATLADAD
ncbi:MAG TPA: PaaI family thioesterase [Solirubrobacteraceae bacterium]|nr:PaaI family thioesterase [Solirubrobacteraceae bacterium]